MLVKTYIFAYSFTILRNSIFCCKSSGYSYLFSTNSNCFNCLSKLKKNSIDSTRYLCYSFSSSYSFYLLYSALNISLHFCHRSVYVSNSLHPSFDFFICFHSSLYFNIRNLFHFIKRIKIFVSPTRRRSWRFSCWHLLNSFKSFIYTWSHFYLRRYCDNF